MDSCVFSIDVLLRASSDCCPCVCSFGRTARQQERMFFPRDMLWGWAQFDLAPPHNEIDPGICAGNAGQYGGVNAPCSMFARYMLSGMLEVRPFGRGQLRRFMVFGAPSFLFGKTIPQTLYTWSPDAIGIEHSWGVGIYIERDSSSASPSTSSSIASARATPISVPPTRATTDPGDATSASASASISEPGDGEGRPHPVLTLCILWLTILTFSRSNDRVRNHRFLYNERFSKGLLGRSTMAGSYNGVTVPSGGKKIGYAAGKYDVPDNPIVPFIEGDGTGRDIWKASLRVFDAAVEKAYRGKRRVAWYEVFAGEKAKAKFDNWLPDDTVDAIREFRVAIKGPLTTPVGGGIRSLNVALRQILDLYCCVRPVKYYQGVPSPVKNPERMDVVIYRENTEDVYAGIEWEQGTAECARLIEFLNKDMLKGGKKQIRLDSGVGIKPISVTGTKRLVRMAILHALETGRKSVTLVHKGNIQKFTEGAFRKWGYELATEEFRDKVVTERESWIRRQQR